ncbi:MAG: cell division protein ZapB [candidate division KSB1 bacterium]
MKKHLYYTFLVIFVATTVVTLLGVTGVVRIPDGYLTPLFTAFLVELAGAVVAIFLRADFFSDDEHKYVETIRRVQEEHRQTQERLAQTTSLSARLNDDLQRIKEENEHLRSELAKLTSLRLRVLALLGADSFDPPNIMKSLELFNDPNGRQEAMSVIGALVQDGTIEPDTNRSSGYYRLRKSR